MSEFRYVTKGINRTDGELIVTGRARYTCDMELPGMLVAKILSPRY